MRRLLEVSVAAQPHLAMAVQEAVAEVDKDQSIFLMAPMEDWVADSLTERRFAMLLLGLFGMLALTLAGGVYGVVSYEAAQRTREIGIRIALGATTREVLRLVIRQGMKPALYGVVLGLLGALALTRLIKSLLFGVSASDPLTFLLVAALLGTVALLACYLPARRAASVDPMIALRHE
jgi:putative ABC transport system permease protein